MTTALPTFLTHRRGRTVPILMIPLVRQINACLQILRSKKNELTEDLSWLTPETRELIYASGLMLKGVYEGDVEIKQALAQINELQRVFTSEFVVVGV